MFLGLFSFWCGGNNYIACFLCSGFDYEEECIQVLLCCGELFCLFFSPSTASSAVSAVKIFWTAVAAHIQHRNVCLVVARHACSGCACFVQCKCLRI